MRRLPPLTAVEAFVQVARLGSVKAAAEALALSSPALSRRVQSMERFVGRSLFDRRHQAVVLNAEGERLLTRLAPALDALAEAIEPGAGESEILRLRLGVVPLYASQRLIGGLRELRTLHPELHVDIDTAAHPLVRLNEGLDAAITVARGIDPTLYSRRLEETKVVAIASRELVEGADAIRRPEDIARTTALVHRDLPEAFSVWMEAIGNLDIQPAAIDQFDSGQLMLDAAAQGLGVAFMLEMHLENAHNDALVRLFDLDVHSPYSYWFACRRAALVQRPVKVFHDWLFGAGEEAQP
ncbi:LysR substrate-binding domain-containing protein [Sphingomonas sp. ID0503]|uniref:LysR substrate-binding domain-containing protein n=1 Tax=Sphingomonas sp. ID0503 TaxID=3399691 RepID=UPI003AFACF01